MGTPDKPQAPRAQWEGTHPALPLHCSCELELFLAINFKATISGLSSCHCLHQFIDGILKLKDQILVKSFKKLLQLNFVVVILSFPL